MKRNWQCRSFFIIACADNSNKRPGAVLPEPTADLATEENQADAADRRAQEEFVRGVSGFRSAIGDADFPAEPGRYHLFVALNCPWCHRVTLTRNVLGLQSGVSMDVAFPGRTEKDDPAGENLWEFNPERVAIRPSPL